MNKEVEAYIRKQKTPQKKILEHVREIFLETLPGCGEEIRWGVPVFSGGRFYVAAVKDGVNVGFAVAGLSKEEVKLFSGGGRTMRHIKYRSVDEVDEKKLAELIKLVDKKAVCEEAC